jgi:PHD/YefM family antitoxin component YafN of YafNO toxin-antitoxin module
MKSIYLLLFGALNATVVCAQNDQQAIQQWQSAHPTTLFISAERYNALSLQEQELLGADLIIYQDKISLAVIEQHEALIKSENDHSQKPTKTEDLSIIKNWTANNPDVKIVPRSVYDAAEDDRKQVYSENTNCLILEGEWLTVKDIELFEQQH